MLGKGEMVMGIVELFDALDKAKRDAEDAGRPAPGIVRTDGAGGLSPIDERMIESGRIRVYESCVYSWKECKATKDEESGEIKVTPYERWLEEKIGSIPDFMSRSDFYEYFSDRLKTDYEREKQEAIAKLAVEGGE